MHLVHFDTQYADVSDAASHSEGLAVLGVFIKVWEISP